MKKIILIKYGELNTKKDNKRYFLDILKNNIDNKLINIDYKLYYDYGRMFIESNENDLIIDKLRYVFGIQELAKCYQDNDKDIDNICNNALSILNNKKINTFKIVTKRSDKNYKLNSMEVSRIIGSFILKNIDDIKVDVHNPDIILNIEIRKDEVLYYIDTIKAIGGYPVSTLGKGLLMLSGGIDSPVAGYLACKRGVKIDAIYFESPPHTSDMAKDKVIKLARELAKYNGDIKLHIINFTKIQEEILKNIPNNYLITIMRRMMYRICEIIANKNNYQILINGESIGQVASQTLSSISVINEVINIPVIRPLACFDKLEIIDIAKKINTYEISILPYEDCCTVFVPEHPVINPLLSKCIEYEKLIPFINYINDAILNEEIINVNEIEENKFKDIL